MDLLPPVLFPGSTSTERKRLLQLKKEGRVRQVGPRLYVSVPESETEATLRATWASIVATLFPKAFLSHRTALEFAPTPEGEIFITGKGNREVIYPGLRLKFVRGPDALADDPPFLRIRASSLPRAFLENLSTTHPTSRSRVLPVEKLEERLERLLHIAGEEELNKLRDRAREIAAELGWDLEFQRLDSIIGTLLGTRDGGVTGSVARALGEPFDPRCGERLQLLFGELRAPLPKLLDTFEAPDHFRNKAFFESYFSNYIEGTTFEIAEAEQIIFDHRIPEARPKDAHDIVGTFAVVSEPGDLRRTPSNCEELIHLLQERHRTLMQHRAEVAPGELKTRPNRAGDTQFVHPDYVRGTLRKGAELYADIAPGLARAIFMMFLVSDVHPFVDGNGRLSRVMMNAELFAAGQTTIIIPTVFRDDYMQSLRALTRRNRAGLIVETLVRAQRFSHREFSPYPETLAELRRRNWFRDPDEARIIDGKST